MSVGILTRLGAGSSDFAVALQRTIAGLDQVEMSAGRQLVEGAGRTKAALQVEGLTHLLSKEVDLAARAVDHTYRHSLADAKSALAMLDHLQGNLNRAGQVISGENLLGATSGIRSALSSALARL